MLDADGGDIFFKDGGTTFGSATNTSGNLIIKSGTTTALTFSGANVTGAGTYTGGGTMTTGGNIVIPDAGNIGSASDTDAIAIASDGVVTFSQVPVLPDDTVATADIQDNAVTLAKMAGLARGKIIVGDASGDPSVLSAGSNGTFLKSDGTDLSFATPSVALDDVATGDAAVTLATSAGNITIDAQGNDTDIILKGTDGGADKTAINIDMSENALIKFPNDSQALSFGADGDVTLTHVADTGLTLSAPSALTEFQIDGDDAGSGGGPRLIFNRTSDSPAANDYSGTIIWNTENDNDQQFKAAQISVQATDVSDGTEDSNFQIATIVNGTATTGVTVSGSGIQVPDSGKIGSVSAPSAIDINSAGEVGVGTTANTSATLNVYNNETGHHAINVHQDNSSSTTAVVNIVNDGEGYGFYNVSSNGSGTFTQASRGTAGYYRQTGGVASNYALYAQSDSNYGVYARTLSSSYGAVIGYDHDVAGYCILGYQSTYAFYGAGNGYVSGSYSSSDER